MNLENFHTQFSNLLKIIQIVSSMREILWVITSKILICISLLVLKLEGEIVVSMSSKELMGLIDSHILGILYLLLIILIGIQSKAIHHPYPTEQSLPPKSSIFLKMSPALLIYEF